MTSATIFGTTIDPGARRKRGRPRVSTVAQQRQKHIACAEMHYGPREWKIQTIVNELRRAGKRASVRSVKTWIKLALTYPECAPLAIFARPRRTA